MRNQVSLMVPSLLLAETSLLSVEQKPICFMFMQLDNNQGLLINLFKLRIARIIYFPLIKRNFLSYLIKQFFWSSQALEPQDVGRHTYRKVNDGEFYEVDQLSYSRIREGKLGKRRI